MANFFSFLLKRKLKAVEEISRCLITKKSEITQVKQS